VEYFVSITIGYQPVRIPTSGLILKRALSINGDIEKNYD
jgi:hypothetical protein